MFYVVREGEGLDMYHARFLSLPEAKEYALNLKATYGHVYEIVRVETVLTTKTLAERSKEKVQHD